MKSLVIVGVVVAAILGIAALSGGDSTDRSDPIVPTVAAPGDPLGGTESYTAACSNCHGSDLQGVAGLGNRLAPSDFITQTSEDDLVDLIINGRPGDHPDSVTGIAMVPRAGNPSLSDATVRDIAAYLKASN